MKTVISLCAALLFSGVSPPFTISDPALLFDPTLAAKADPQFDSATYEKLKKLTIDVRWDKTDIQSALADLAAKSLKTDPDHVGVRFVLQLSGGDPEVAKKVPHDVQITLTNVPLFDVMQYFSQQTNLIPQIHKNCVIMVPGHETRYSFHTPQ